MDDQTELALDSKQPGHPDSDTDHPPAATPAMHAPHGEHDILDEFLSGADQGYMRPDKARPHGLSDWLKLVHSKSATAVSRWFPPWLSADAREKLQQTPPPPPSPTPPILTSATASNQQTTSGPWPMGPRTALAAAVLTIAALLTAATALWFSADLNAELGTLRTELAQVRNTALHPAASETDLELLAMHGQLDGLRDRLDTLAEGQLHPLPVPEQQPGDRDALLARLSALERIAAQWKQQQAVIPDPPSSPASPKPTSAPVAHATPPGIEKPKVMTEDSHQATPRHLQPPPVATLAAAPKAATAKPIQRHNGPWVVNLLSVSSRAEARREIKRLKKMDIHAEIQTAKVRQHTWYRIQVTGFASSAKAQDFGDRIAVQTGLKDAWAARK